MWLGCKTGVAQCVSQGAHVAKAASTLARTRQRGTPRQLTTTASDHVHATTQLSCFNFGTAALLLPPGRLSRHLACAARRPPRLHPLAPLSALPLRRLRALRVGFRVDTHNGLGSGQGLIAQRLRCKTPTRTAHDHELNRYSAHST
jgi:hypothetical protein